MNKSGTNLLLLGVVVALVAVNAYKLKPPDIPPPPNYDELINYYVNIFSKPVEPVLTPVRQVVINKPNEKTFELVCSFEGVLLEDDEVSYKLVGDDLSKIKIEKDISSGKNHIWTISYNSASVNTEIKFKAEMKYKRVFPSILGFIKQEIISKLGDDIFGKETNKTSKEVSVIIRPGVTVEKSNKVVN